MRNSLIAALDEAAGSNPRLTLVTGDLGYSVLETFAKNHPKQYLNAGVAEQNMAGLAAGLAQTGRKVFTYTIVNFAVARCLEQIRNDICYHEADVCVVAVGGGVAYGTAAYTHWGVEDVALLRSLPRLRIYTPADRAELSLCVAEILKTPGPSYLRLGKGGEPAIHQAPPAQLGLIEVQRASALNVVAAGPILAEAQKAVRTLAERGLDVGLFSLPHMSPESAQELRELAARSRCLVSLEEHSTLGGLGSFVAEISCALPAPTQVIRLGLEHERLTKIGSQDFLRRQNGLDAGSLVETLTQLSGRLS